MGKRWTWVAWSMLAIFVAAMGVGMALMVVNGEFQQDPTGHGSLLLAFTAFMVVGAVVVAQRPDNRVGWGFSAIGLLAATGVLAWQYAEYAYTTRGGSLPGAILCAWYTSWWWYPVIGLASLFTLLLFPTGRLLSPRWRPVSLLAAATILAFIVMSALQPTLKPGGGAKIPNPIGLAAIPDPDASTLGDVLLGLYVVCTGAAALSLVLRLRRSQGVDASSSSGSPMAARCCSSGWWSRISFPTSPARGCSLVSPLPCCRSLLASRSSATGCTTSTG